jgi:hypothetical protein
MSTRKAVPTLKVGDKVRMPFSSGWSLHEVSAAKGNDGCCVMGGPQMTKPWAFIFACCAVIDAEGRGSAYEFRDAYRLNYSDIINIEGHGKHMLIERHNGHVGLIRLHDCFVNCDCLTRKGQERVEMVRRIYCRLFGATTFDDTHLRPKPGYRYPSETEMCS